MNETEIQYKLNLNAYLAGDITLEEYNERAERIADDQIIY